MIQEYTPLRVLISRLPHGGDLLESITTICTENEIHTASVKAIGALSSAVIGFYDQEAQQYITIELEGRWEVASLMGNVSIRDGQPFCHLHVTLADEKGNAKGGHLMKGCTIYAGEAVIEEFSGPELVREFDEETQLYLWK